jgi:hypothetical protein
MSELKKYVAIKILPTDKFQRNIVTDSACACFPRDRELFIIDEMIHGEFEDDVGLGEITFALGTMCYKIEHEYNIAKPFEVSITECEDFANLPDDDE